MYHIKLEPNLCTSLVIVGSGWKDKNSDVTQIGVALENSKLCVCVCVCVRVCACACTRARAWCVAVCACRCTGAWVSCGDSHLPSKPSARHLSNVKQKRISISLCGWVLCATIAIYFLLLLQML
jgi:hypothetical protein